MFYIRCCARTQVDRNPQTFCNSESVCSIGLSESICSYPCKQQTLRATVLSRLPATLAHSQSLPVRVIDCPLQSLLVMRMYFRLRHSDSTLAPASNVSQYQPNHCSAKRASIRILFWWVALYVMNHHITIAVPTGVRMQIHQPHTTALRSASPVLQSHVSAVLYTSSLPVRNL